MKHYIIMRNINRGTKIAVLGAGNVVSTVAYTLAVDGMASEIALVGIRTDKAQGDRRPETPRPAAHGERESRAAPQRHHAQRRHRVGEFLKQKRWGADIPASR